MINPDDPPDIQVEKLQKVVKALMWRVEQNNEKGGTPYTMFQTAISLESEVQARTVALQETLEQLEQTHGDLATALQEAERSRQILLDALEVMNEGFALFADDRLVICNDRFKNLLPDVSDQIMDEMTFRDYARIVSKSVFLHRAEDQSSEDWLRFRLAQHGRQQATFILRLPDDQWIQVSDRKMPKNRVAILHTDITKMVHEQRSQGKKVLDEQARLARATIDHMSQGVCTFDAKHLLVASNSGFGDLLSLPFHMSQNGTPLKTILDYLEKNKIMNNHLLRQEFLPWMGDKITDRKLQLELHRFDGSIIDASFRKLPDGGFVVSFTDVTTERRATEALSEAKDTLEQNVRERTSELMEANKELLRKTHVQKQTEQELREAKEDAEAANLSKTRFLAAASHDLLQPLNAAKLFLASLTQTALDDAQIDIADRLCQSFNSVESILDALLDLSRLDAKGAEFTITRFPISAVLEPLQAEYEQIAAEKGLELHVVPSAITVVSDQRYLHRIIQNLLSNAVKYTTTGKVLLGCRRRGNHVEIQVIDTGIGIAQKDHNRVFEEFQRLANDGADQGMGLGLSFVERACRQLNHELLLDSKPGQGSLFSVKVECSQQAVAQATSYKGEPEVVDGMEANVLAVLVENDLNVLHAMTGTLERWGISVIPAKSTQELLFLVDELGVPPDIIIADYHLDGKDTGLTAIRSLRQSVGQNIPSILVTADRSKKLKQNARKMGTEILTKPVELQALRSLVRWGIQ
ncbi:hybrid sensor histidine kinase/response regulator [Profundibacter amoris]|uniref:histidine kinase n=1 Tax=Profundibacter amoris TaxID=2171755 RepID=A0A347UCU3_9RHOB|nr:PAS-domain containing protein [Profundibacter amoris]AXX96671.1 response regulator [Profundibacter amoris]